jgi:signal transduction histidine kinase
MPDVVEIGYSNPVRWQYIAGFYQSENAVNEDFAIDQLLYKSYSIKFSNPVRSIRIAVESKSEAHSIIICDQGIGMNSETINNLFKINSTHSSKGTSKESGSGLGLLLCKEYIDKHAGKIAVEIAPNQGSKFTVTLASSALPTHNTA